MITCVCTTESSAIERDKLLTHQHNESHNIMLSKRSQTQIPLLPFYEIVDLATFIYMHKPGSVVARGDRGDRSWPQGTDTKELLAVLKILGLDCGTDHTGRYMYLSKVKLYTSVGTFYCMLIIP